MAAVIECSGISKIYRIYDSPAKRLLELVTFRRRTYHRNFHALSDVSFEILPGESVALLGENGSGKSTLLQIIAGILVPTSGRVQVNGRVAALLELGSGFNPEFSGRDNVLLGASLLGISGAEIERVYEAIVEFSGIKDFIHQPVRTYSSGMAVRLAFSVAIHCRPEILLVDEALAVGDLAFRQRCLQKMEELRQNGVTLILVSHSAAETKQFCERAIWLDAGTLRLVGPSDRVVEDYLAAMAEKDARYLSRCHEVPENDISGTEEYPRSTPLTPVSDIERNGTGKGMITGLALVDHRQRPMNYMEAFRPINLVIAVHAKQELSRPVVGFTVRNHIGMTFLGTDTRLEGCDLPTMKPGDSITVSFRITPPELYAATLSFSVYLNEGHGSTMSICDIVEDALAVQMMSTGLPVYGYLHVPCETKVYVNEGAAVNVG